MEYCLDLISQVLGHVVLKFDEGNEFTFTILSTFLNLNPFTGGPKLFMELGMTIVSK